RHIAVVGLWRSNSRVVSTTSAVPLPEARCNTAIRRASTTAAATQRHRHPQQRRPHQLLRRAWTLQGADGRQPMRTVLAAMNKCLARSNKSRTGDKATKKRTGACADNDQPLMVTRQFVTSTGTKGWASASTSI